MKKNLLFLWMVLVTLSFFNSCSDDDKNQEWENLPTGPIQSDKVSIDLNGTATSGTVTLKATSNEAAQIQFQNVIPGYSDVTVDVKMEKQPDNSFTFSGTKNMATAPTKAEATPVFLTVTVNGTIAADGKVTVNIATSGLGTYIGTYSGATLKLMYGDGELTGKSVIFDATQPQDASIKLTDVIPGDTVTLLTGIQLNDNGFSGSTTTAAAKVDYTGALKDKVLTLNLNVTMNDPQGWAGTYGLAEITKGNVEQYTFLSSMTTSSRPGITVSCCYCTATVPIPSNNLTTEEGKQIANMLNNPNTIRQIVGCILPQVLKSVTLKTNGNIEAEYSSDSIKFQIQWMNPAALTPETVASFSKGRKWKKSPKNLAYWFEKNEKLYLKLNISAIVAQALSDNNQQENIEMISSLLNIILNGSVSDIKEMIKGLSSIPGMESISSLLGNLNEESIGILLTWVKEGIPLSVTFKDNHTCIYLEKDELTPIINILPSFIPLIKDANPMGMGNMLNSTLSGIAQGWKWSTGFNLGLELTK